MDTALLLIPRFPWERPLRRSASELNDLPKPEGGASQRAFPRSAWERDSYREIREEFFMKLSDFVVPDAIITDLKVPDKAGAIRDLVGSLKGCGIIAADSEDSIVAACSRCTPTARKARVLDVR